MTYQTQLLPWSIIRYQPNKCSQVLVRFRRCQDAEAHLQILKANNPTTSYELVFDVKSQPSDLTGKQALIQFQPDVD